MKIVLLCKVTIYMCYYFFLICFSITFVKRLLLFIHYFFAFSEENRILNKLNYSAQIFIFGTFSLSAKSVGYNNFSHNSI